MNGHGSLLPSCNRYTPGNFPSATIILLGFCSDPILFETPDMRHHFNNPGFQHNQVSGPWNAGENSERAEPNIICLMVKNA